MQRFEYRVMPAPRRADKVRGAKTTEDRFAASLTAVMNALGDEGWEYLRADTLPCEERSGLTGSKTTFQTLLIFRRPLEEPAPPGVVGTVAPVAEPRPEPLPVPPAAAPVRRPTPLWLGKADAPAGPAPALGPAAPRPPEE